MPDAQVARLPITSASLHEASSTAGGTLAYAASPRAPEGLWTPTRGALNTVRGERTGECVPGGMCQNPLCDGGQIIRNIAGRSGRVRDSPKRIFLVRGFRRSYRGLSRPNHHHIAHPDPRQMNVPKLKVRKDRMASDLTP